MDSQVPVMLRLLATSVSIANRAGVEVRRILKTGKLDIVDKGFKDYQTEADRTAQRLIVSSLAKRFPKCTIIGEEDLEENAVEDAKLIVDTFDSEILKLKLPSQYEQFKEDEITIWVDPLDGTTEFVKGFVKHVTVLIGIAIGGRSVGGIIHQPFYKYSPDRLDEAEGRTIWGLVGLGCFGLEKTKPQADKLLVTTTASHGNNIIEDALKAIKPDEIIRVGGAGNKVLMVIEAKAHAYVFTSKGCKKWDTCAPEAILESLGGKLTDSLGNHINYRDGETYHNLLGVIASVNPEVHSKVINVIPESVKTHLLEMKDQSPSKY